MIRYVYSLVHPKRNENICLQNTCTLMFTAVLFIIAQRQKEPKCPTMDGWIYKIQYIHTMGYYSDKKSKEVETLATTWMNLESIMLNECLEVRHNKEHIA